MKVRVGRVGCGSICEHRHAPEYHENPNVEIVSFYDPTRERAEKMAGLYGGKPAVDFTDITRDPRIDAISDCSTNEMHHVISTDALEHGKHVLCEKPMATTVQDARSMVEAGRKAGRILMIGYNQRLAGGHRKAKEILKSGELGRVISFHTVFGHGGPEYWSVDRSRSTWFFDARRSVFGAAGDLGIHKIDLLRFLLEDEIVEVSSFAETLDKTREDGKPIPVNDNIVCLLRTRTGTVGTLAASWTYYGAEDNSTALFCEKGILRIYADPSYQVVVTKPGGEAAFYRVSQIQTNEAQVKSGVIDAFIDSIAGGAPPLTSGEDGLRSLQVVTAAMESAAKKSVVRISYE